MQIGSIRIDPVVDATFRHPPTTTYRGGPAPDEVWEPHRNLLDENGLTESTMGGFLVRGGSSDAGRERVALVDLGLGDRDMMGMRGGALLESLRALGVSPEDVTDVLFTHLHLDHIGWTAVDGELTFPNATYRCDAAEWDHWFADSPGEVRSFVQRQRDVVAPAADRLVTWDADGPVVAGIDALRTPGHTPGSTTLVVSDGDRRALLLGDLVHCAVELLDDEWDGLFDVDPVQAKAVRNALVRELEGTDTPVAAAHFPGLRFGRVLPGERRGRRFEFTS
jgi:glyoxylase-like metal-dependent hydrolase (beta-lactamase superfamily II)